MYICDLSCMDIIHAHCMDIIHAHCMDCMCQIDCTYYCTYHTHYVHVLSIIFLI